MKITETEISKVIPYARNPRNNIDAVSGVAASLKEYGWQQPIVVDSEMVVVVGHTRLLAAQQLGMDKVPVHIAVDLSPQQIKAYRLADNRFGENANWDMDLLKIEFEDLDSDGFDLDLTGFHASELNFEEVDYSILDGDGDVDGAISDLEGGVKKAIQIEFESEHYDEAKELFKWWRDNGSYIGYMLMEFLRSEKNKS